MFDLKPEDRLHFWRQFRADLKSLPEEEALQAVVDLWGKAPTTNGYLDWTRCEEWPDPWTLLNDNHYCDVAIALGIFYTIYLSEILDNSTISVVIYKSETKFVNAVHITKYALNIVYRQVVNTTSIPQDLSIQKVFTVEDLKAQKYL